MNPKEITCGAARANYNPDAITRGTDTPDRFYHFRVSEVEATQLVRSGKYIYREPSGTSLPFTVIPCTRFGLLPNAS